MDWGRGDRSRKVARRRFALLWQRWRSHHAYGNVYRPRAVYSRHDLRSPGSSDQPPGRPPLGAAAGGLPENQMIWRRWLAIACVAVANLFCLDATQWSYAAEQAEKISSILVS